MSDPSSGEGASADGTGGPGVSEIGILTRLKDWVVRKLCATPSWSHKEVEHRLGSISTGDYVAIRLDRKSGGQYFEGRVLPATKFLVRRDAVHLDGLLDYNGGETKSFSVPLRAIHSIEVSRELRSR